jgi:hypothetical protein
MLAREATRFLDALSPTGQTRVINAANDLKFCPFFMVASIFFGQLNTALHSELHKLGALREDLFRDTFKGGMNRYSMAKYLPGSAMSRLRVFQRSWEAFVQQALLASASSDTCAIGPLWASVQSGELSLQEVEQFSPKTRQFLNPGLYGIASADNRRVFVCKPGRDNPRGILDCSHHVTAPGYSTKVVF